MSAPVPAPPTPLPTPDGTPAQARPLDRSPLFSSVGRFHPWEPARVEGTIPRDLRGTLIRTGPGLLERFGQRVAHSFEADGVLMGVRFEEDGKASRAVRVVQSPGYLEEEAAGRALYGSSASLWRRLTNMARGRSKSTGNTSVMHWQGRTYALMEGARPVEVDHATLDTGKVSDLGGVLGPAFSAHPHRLASRGTTFNFGQIWGPKPALELYALPEQGAASCLGRVPIPWNTMVHDFAITERYAVFIVCPAKLRMHKALLGADFDEFFAWDGDEAAHLIVAPLDAPERAITIELKARWVFHLSNAFERDGRLVIDWVQYDNFDVFAALAADGSETDVGHSQLQRVEIDPQSRRLVSDEVLWGRDGDFPVLPASRVGTEYSTCWMTVGEADFGGGVARLDTVTGATDEWRPGHGYHASEALFVPRNDAARGDMRDDDGWLVALVYDAHAGQSYYVVLDADRPSAGPLAKVWMGQALPLTFHGTFIAA